MKKIKYAIGIIFGVLIMVACLGFVFRSKLLAHVIPKVKQVEAIHINLKNDTSYVSTRLLVTNQLFFKIGIDTIRYEVGLFDKIYLQNKKSLGIKLPAYGSDTFDFSLKIPYVAILTDLQEARKKGDSIDYSVSIDLGYSTIFGASEIPINKEAKLKMPQPPELKIEEIKWNRISLKSIQAIAVIKIINNSAIALSLHDISYAMNISEHGTLKGTYKKQISIVPHNSTSIELPIEIELNNLGKSLFKVLTNEDTRDYTLTVNTTVETSNPLKESFLLNLTNSGKIELKK